MSETWGNHVVTGVRAVPDIPVTSTVTWPPMPLAPPRPRIRRYLLLYALLFNLESRGAPPKKNIPWLLGVEVRSRGCEASCGQAKDRVPGCTLTEIHVLDRLSDAGRNSPETREEPTR